VGEPSLEAGRRALGTAARDEEEGHAARRANPCSGEEGEGSVRRRPRRRDEGEVGETSETLQLVQGLGTVRREKERSLITERRARYGLAAVWRRARRETSGALLQRGGGARRSLAGETSEDLQWGLIT
jgi:hypothetical protein